MISHDVQLKSRRFICDKLIVLPRFKDIFNQTLVIDIILILHIVVKTFMSNMREEMN